MINISTKNFEVTESIDGKVRSSFQKHYNFVSKDASFDVHLERTTNHHKKGDIYKVHVVLRAGGKRWNAESHGEDIYKIVDEVSEKLEREVKYGGAKLRDKGRNLARKAKDILKSLNPFK